MALNIFTQVVAPTVSMALTSGPTTPEVASFEPVDNTDMVNLVSGDLTYNIPLLEVPGPEGGYPLALSYHAGILPGQDASWVGLGWNLNPGAINRMVNNFADDYKNAQYTIKDTWVGGVTQEYNFGVGLGIANTPIAVGVDVGIKHDTYKGSGGSVGFSIGTQGGLYSAGASIGVDSWSGTYVGGSFGVGNANVSGGYGDGDGYASASLGVGNKYISGGVTANYAGGQMSAAVGLASDITQSNLGITMSSHGLKASGQVVGVFVGHNDNYGKISTSSGGFGISIPIYSFIISVGYKYTRYWMNEQDNTYLYGVLNSKAATDYGSTFWDVDDLRTFDCSVLTTPTQSLIDQGNVDWMVNPMAPTYDSYTVLAQGLSGSMEPALLDNGGLFQRKYNEGGAQETKYFFHRRFTKDKHFFRFVNDFSNSHRVTPVDFTYLTDPGFYYPDTDLAYTVKDIDPRGYKKSMNGTMVTEARFAGSKHIEYYSNSEITSGAAKTAGFIDTKNISATERATRDFGMGQAIVQNYDISNNIGGYSVTNESGVTYHYALPAYTYNFYQETSQDGKSTGRTKRQVYNNQPYAYTWLLTAVTGPDYLDKNNNGLADSGDWGYYVNFDYGRWHHRVGFRTPEEGATTDIDGATTFSRGFKELYYLNAVSTRTHTALFLKDTRSDAKGLRASDGDSFETASFALNDPVYDPTTCQSYSAVTALKLSEIMVIENSKLIQLGVNWLNGTIYDDYSASIDLIKNGAAKSCFIPNACISCSSISAGAFPTTYYYSDQKVIETRDLSSSALADFRNKAIKRVAFEQDYTLCPNTTNSFDTDPTIKKGKLTLNKIRFYGVGNVQLMPSTNFDYTIPNPISTSIAPTWVPGDNGWTEPKLGRIFVSSNNFQVGDILTFQAYSGGVLKDFYISLVRVASPQEFDVVYIGNNVLTPADKTSGGSQINVTATQTKNPPYARNATDLWGSFKSDYRSLSNVKRNKRQLTTAVSAKAVDCWSLRSVESATGSKIKLSYESDDYRDVVLKNRVIYNLKPNIKAKPSANSTFSGSLRSFSGSDLAYLNSTSLDFAFDVYDGDVLTTPMNEVFTVGDKVEIVSAGEYFSGLFFDNLQCYYRVNKTQVEVTAVTATSITLRDPNRKICVPANSIYFTGSNTNTWNSYTHMASYIVAPDKQIHYGGGLRAKSIEVTDGSTSHITTYQYNANGSSAGSTAYDPLNFDELETITDYSWAQGGTVSAAAKKDYGRYYYAGFESIMACAKDIVAPGVLYETVKINSSVVKNGVTTQAPTSQMYQFQPFTAEMVQFVDLLPEEHANYSYRRTSKIINKTSQLGNLLSIKTYDRGNNLLAEISNQYTSEFENGQGQIEQVFHSERRMNPDQGAQFEKKIAVVSVLSDYPSVLTSTTTKNFVKGQEATQRSTAFDFYTGNVTETQTTDSYGNTYMAIVDPAYNWYNSNYAGMGLKLYNGGMNMLIQNAGSYMIKKNTSPTSYAATVTSAALTIAPNQILVTLSGGNKLPVSCHVGSRITGLALPVFVTSISNNRTSFNAISRAASIGTDLGAKTISFDDGNVVNASVTTWSENWNYRTGSPGNTYATTAMSDYTYYPNQYTGILIDQTKWRVKSSYIWDSPYLNTNGDGTYATTGVGAFVPFDYSATGAQASAYWKAAITNTLYTQYSKMLESKNVNNQYTATKYSGDESFICGTAANSRYTEFTVNSAEHYEGEFGGFNSTTYAHTGVYSFRLNASGDKISYSIPYTLGSTDAGNGFDKGKQYRISAWVHKDNIMNAQLFYTSTVNGTPTTTTQVYDAAKHIQCGNWILMTMDITTSSAAGTNLSMEVGVKNVGASNYVYADDFRFQPFVSSVQSYVYDLNSGLLTYVLGTDNRYVRYEYDSRGRVKATYKETTSGEVKMNEYNYNFSRLIN
ncbi:MAG: hypothetical protein ACTHJT_09190 [Cytophaga sp.]|uniref:hypothetical protein n=1 Tax=Cytophaga sp. TaxID=29535 RepID=UPI003F81633A